MLNVSCTSDFSYFDSPDFLKLSLHIITSVSTPAYCLGIYCILFKTPNQMASVKWYLLTLHMWITVFDYSVSLLTVPYLLIPEVAGILYGLLSVLGVPTCVQVVFTIMVLACMITSILSVYENRFFILCRFRFKEKWARGRRVWLFLHYLINFAACHTLFFVIPDQVAVKQEVFKKLPCLPDYIHNEPIFILFTNLTFPTFLLAPIITIYSLEFLIFSYFLVNSGSEHKKSMSQKTYQMHKQFFIAIFIQLSVPFCMLSVPLIYEYAAFLFKYYNQAVMNFAVIIFTTHGFVSTFVMILVHRPYRLAVQELKRKDRRTITKSAVVSVNLPRFHQSVIK